ncbi:MAG TPA: hypothetical protein VF276_19535, partial [Chloroflexia bacterium]
DFGQDQGCEAPVYRGCTRAAAGTAGAGPAAGAIAAEAATGPAAGAIAAEAAARAIAATGAIAAEAATGAITAARGAIAAEAATGATGAGGPAGRRASGARSTPAGGGHIAGFFRVVGPVAVGNWPAWSGRASRGSRVDFSILWHSCTS